MTSFLKRLADAKSGTNPAAVCQVASGWVVLCDMQYLRGYTILLADPPVESINVLARQKRMEFLSDMAMIGDALLEVTGAYRVNYAIAGNSDPYLHAHIIPRYLEEPEPLRRNQPWAYPKETMESVRFDAGRDQELMLHLARAIQEMA